jgi:hypothetical protein
MWWLVAVDEDDQPVVGPSAGRFILFRSIGPTDTGDEDSLVGAPIKPAPNVDTLAIALPEPRDEDDAQESAHQ